MFKVQRLIESILMVALLLTITILVYQWWLWGDDARCFSALCYQ